MNELPIASADWVPSGCTLPSAEQPVRTAEFDDLFRTAVTDVEQAAGEVVLRLDPGLENAARAARLAAMESGCCSFFSFELSIGADVLTLRIAAGPAHDHVLTALAARARGEGGTAP